MSAPEQRTEDSQREHETGTRLLSTLLTGLPIALILLCPLLLYLNADLLMGIGSGVGFPSYPDYPQWQNVERRIERVGKERFVITTFETADDSEKVAEFYNDYFGRDGRWYDQYAADYSNPIEWRYDTKYCPATAVFVQRTEHPTGMTRVEVRVSEESCFQRGN